MDEVIVEQAMFQLIDGPPRLCRQLIEPDPDEERTTDMIALNPRLSTLAAFEPRDLLTFPVQLLDLPTKATRLLGGLRRILSGIVSHDPIRAAGRHHNPEQTHLVVLGKTLKLDPLTVGQLSRVPVPRIHPAIGSLAVGIIHLA